MVKKTERPTSVLVALHNAMAGREIGRGSNKLAARTSSIPNSTYKGSVKPVQICNYAGVSALFVSHHGR